MIRYGRKAAENRRTEAAARPSEDPLRNLPRRGRVTSTFHGTQDKKIEELTTRLKKLEKAEERNQNHHAGIKLLEADSSQIMQQYEKRL